MRTELLDTIMIVDLILPKWWKAPELREMEPMDYLKSKVHLLPTDTLAYLRKVLLENTDVDRQQLKTVAERRLFGEIFNDNNRGFDLVDWVDSM